MNNISEDDTRALTRRMAELALDAHSSSSANVVEVKHERNRTLVGLTENAGRHDAKTVYFEVKLEAVKEKPKS